MPFYSLYKQDIRLWFRDNDGNRIKDLHEDLFMQKVMLKYYS